MTDNSPRPQGQDDNMMSGATADEETLGQDYNAAPGARMAVQSIEQVNDDPNDELAGYYPQVSDANAMPPPPPPPRARVDSVASADTDLNSPDVIAALVGPVDDRGTGTDLVRPSPRPSPRPRQLNLGNSMLNRRHRQQSEGARDRALSMQRDLASRFRTNHDEQAAMMTTAPPEQNPDEMRMTPFLDAYDTANFSNARPEYRHKQMVGKLNRQEELHWIKMEARRRRRNENRARSVTPVDEDETGKDRAAAVFSEIQKIYERKKQAGTLTVDEEVAYVKIEAKEAGRLRRRDGANSRASTPSSASGIFVGDAIPRQRGFAGFGGDRGPKFPRQKFIMACEARKKANKDARAGNVSFKEVS